jgi:hypothetical protein
MVLVRRLTGLILSCGLRRRISQKATPGQRHSAQAAQVLDFNAEMVGSVVGHRLVGIPSGAVSCYAA